MSTEKIMDVSKLEIYETKLANMTAIELLIQASHDTIGILDSKIITVQNAATLILLVTALCNALAIELDNNDTTV